MERKRKAKIKVLYLETVGLIHVVTIESHSGMKKCILYCYGTFQFLKACINNYNRCNVSIYYA